MGIWGMGSEVGGEERKPNMGVERRWASSPRRDGCHWWYNSKGIFSPMGWMDASKLLLLYMVFYRHLTQGKVPTLSSSGI
jgi:hypothetical protein